MGDGLVGGAVVGAAAWGGSDCFSVVDARQTSFSLSVLASSESESIPESSPSSVGGAGGGGISAIVLILSNVGR